MPLPSIGTFSYNSVEFDSAAKVRVSCEYEKDGSNRTTSNLVIKLTATALLVPSDDESVDSLRAKLGEQGKTLLYLDNAFPINVNNPYDGSSIRDVAFGPMPRELAWRPLGGGTSGEIVWQVTTTIPACGHEPSGFSLREFVYSVGFDINERGFTTRTISGYFKIPAYRFSASLGSTGTGIRDLTETADTYRETVLSRFVTLLGYTRRSNFTLSEDKARLNFTITDTQIETNNAWPPYVTNIQVHHRIGWQLRGGSRIANQITGQVTLRENVHPGWALVAFRNAANERFQQALGNKAVKQVFLESLQADEECYGVNYSFSMSYWIAGDVNQGQKGNTLIMNGERFLELSGFGTPMPQGTSWREWDPTRRDYGPYRGPHGLRGTNGQSWDEDHITDQCDGSPLTPLHLPPTLPASPLPSTKASIFTAKCPQKDESWVDYKHTWEEWSAETSISETRKLAKFLFGKADVQQQQGQPESLVIDEQVGTGQNDETLIRNLRDAKGELWVLSGYGRRACYPISKLPDQIKLVDQKATLRLLRGNVARDVATNPLGLKLYTAAFAAVYVPNKSLDTPPDSVSYP